MAQTEVRGLRELMAGLNALPADLSKNAAFQALNAAARQVREEAKRRAPVLKGVARGRKPGTIRAAIRASRSRLSKPGQGWHEVIVRVKPLTDKQLAAFKKTTGLTRGALNPDDPYYWWWLEFGTQKMAARPFLRPAFEGTRSLQIDALRKRLKVRIAAYAAKVKADVDGAR